MIFLLILLFKNEYKYFNNFYWLKIFYHDCRNNNFFNNYSEAIYSLNSKKFSILKNITDKYKINNFFEFLLEYPEVSGYNQWKQSLNPIDNIENSNPTALGYIPISISWNAWNWGGLVLSSSSSWTLLDGSVGVSNWYYSVGSYFNTHYKPYFPGPAFTNSDDYRVSEVYLWVKLNYNPLKTSKKYSNFKLFFFFSNFLI